MPLTLQTANGTQVASLNGPLDQASGTDMVTTIKASVGKGAPLILDFTAVPNMDGSGFRQLLALKRWADQGNSRLILAGMNAESWALVVENNCTNTFESQPSLAAALQSVGKSAAMGGDPTAPNQEPPPRDDFSSFDSGFEGGAEADSAVFSSKPSSASLESDAWVPSSEATAAPEAWGQPGDGASWEKFDRGSLGEEGALENERKGGSRKALHLSLAAVALITLCLGVFWVADYLKEPTIRLDETSIETQAGKELPALSIWVKNGVLSTDELDLPSDIDVIEGEEKDDEREYVLTGTPRKAGKHQITFVAVRENNPARKSPALSLELLVTDVKLDWQQDEKGGLPLNSAGLMEKKAIPQNAISKVVTGAKNVSIEWQGPVLNGVSLARMQNTETSWQLVGTPGNPGNFRAQFIATKLSGETESKSFELTVAALPPPPPVPGPVVKEINSIPPPPPPPPEPDPKADEKMRGFLLERIEKANNHFTEAEKNQLRLVVGMLKEARLLGKVHFKTNSFEISNLEQSKLLKTLKDPATKKLLDNDDCQILVVGYADKTGKRAHNIKLSKLRAREVDLLLKKEIGRRADLSGDYGPTDVISEDSAENRVVEIYAGTIEISELLEAVADKFKEDFNKHHGLR